MRHADKTVCRRKMVRSRGLEPPRLAALAPQASASANFATSAQVPRLRNLPEEQTAAVINLKSSMHHRGGGWLELSCGYLRVVDELICEKTVLPKEMLSLQRS